MQYNIIIYICTQITTNKKSNIMKNSILDYKNSNHSMFTHESVKVNENIIKTIYRNKGYAGKSKIYGSIFQIFNGENTLSFKSKNQVVKYLESLN